MLFCHTAIGKEIPYAFLADPQAVSFLCKTSVNKYESFAVIKNKIIYSSIKLTIYNIEPLAVIHYDLCNVSTDSAFCQIVPLIINRSQTGSILAKNTICYNELLVIEVNDSGIVLCEIAVNVITPYAICILIQTCSKIIWCICT